MHYFDVRSMVTTIFNAMHRSHQTILVRPNNTMARRFLLFLAIVSCLLHAFLFMKFDQHQSLPHLQWSLENATSHLTGRRVGGKDRAIGNNNTGDENKTEESFSACLLWMDDNYRLIEWLAYHYYVLKLRYVVIATDKRSKTSPDTVIRRWQQQNTSHLDMTIVKWKDDDWLPGEVQEYWTNRAINRVTLRDRGPNGGNVNVTKDNVDVKTFYHRQRQREFYKVCTKHLQEQTEKPTRTWTSYHDIDEYIVIQDSNNTDTEIGKHGSVFDRIKSSREEDSTGNDGICFGVKRRRLCSIESSSEDIRKGVPSFLDPLRFDTLRFRHLAEGFDGSSKSIMDVSRFERADSYNGTWTSHMIVENCKGSTLDKTTNGKSLLIYHYLGTWEAYSYRDDARKGGMRFYSRWLARSIDSSKDEEPTDLARPWINGFVDLVGEDLSRYLLEDAGLPASYRNPNTSDWERTDENYKYSLRPI